MKLNINNKTTLLFAFITSGLLHAQTIVPAPGVVVQGGATVEGDAVVNGEFEVTLADLEPNLPIIETLPDGIPNRVTLDADNGPAIRSEEVRRVSLEDTNVIRQGGSTIDPLGNTTLAQRETQVDRASYSIVRTFDVDQDGVEIPGTERFFAARPDTANPGQFLALTRQVLNLATEDPEDTVSEPISFANFEVAQDYANNTFLGDEELAVVTLAGTPESQGGNLTVEGLTTTNGINNSGKKITNIADGTNSTDAASVGQVAAADAAIRSEFAAADTAIRSEFAAADTAIRSEFAAADTAIRSEFAAADTVLGNRITTESSARLAADTAIRGEFAAADTALGGRIDSETAARTSADNLLGGRIDTETAARISQGAAIRSEFAAADTAIRRDFTAADTAIRQEFAAADASLQSQIDENTRGIAMVAAMTNTRVEAGKTHGVDFNIAQFQDETGFAFGYANRINDNVQLHGAVASTDDLNESVARIGVALQW
jgi:hypothetical protein